MTSDQDIMARKPRPDAAHSAGASILLDTKTRPSQERARTTFELILTVTGELLRDVGFERLSTNMICEHAKITPPALYRYFPNKYAILKELARRLMEAQDQVVFDWIAGDNGKGTPEEREESSFRMYWAVVEATRNFPGAVYILRVMRVVPLLQQVRIESRELVSQRFSEAMHARFPKADPKRLETASRLSTEAGYASIEIALEEPELADDVLRELSRMVRVYFDSLTAG